MTEAPTALKGSAASILCQTIDTNTGTAGFNVVLCALTLPRLMLYLLRKLEFGAVSALFGLQAHQVGNRCIEEMKEGGWQDGNIDVLPLEGK